MRFNFRNRFIHKAWQLVSPIFKILQRHLPDGRFRLVGPVRIRQGGHDRQFLTTAAVGNGETHLQLVRTLPFAFQGTGGRRPNGMTQGAAEPPIGWGGLCRWTAAADNAQLLWVWVRLGGVPISDRLLRQIRRCPESVRGRLTMGLSLGAYRSTAVCMYVGHFVPLGGESTLAGENFGAVCRRSLIGSSVPTDHCYSITRAGSK